MKSGTNRHTDKHSLDFLYIDRYCTAMAICEPSHVKNDVLDFLNVLNMKIIELIKNYK